MDCRGTMPPWHLGTLFCLASGAAFGAMGVFGKLAYGEGATVGTLLAVRFTLAAALFWALVLAAAARAAAAGAARAATSPPASRSAPSATRCRPAATSPRSQRIDASLLSLLVYTFPAIVAVAAIALGRERLDARAARRAGARLRRARARRRRRRARARSTRSAPRSGSPRRSSTAPTSSSARDRRRVGPHVLARARLHGRRGRARRPARRLLGDLRPGDADRRRLGLARLPGARLDGRRDRPVLRRPAARRADDRLDPRDRRAARHGRCSRSSSSARR